MQSAILNSPRPWAFSQAELTAGLRAHTEDPTLTITAIQPQSMPYRRPAVGLIRGLHVQCASAIGDRTFSLVLKQPASITRAGMLGAGQREVGLYRNLADQLPMRVPKLLAAHPDGEWLILDLMDGSLDPKRWSAEDYLLATDNLVALHDRFWELGEVLSMYSLLARPLSSDLAFYLSAARLGITRLRNETPSNLLTQTDGLVEVLQRLVEHAEIVTEALRTAPTTLLHGDYWPGNLFIYPDRTLVAYDWQQTAIGPGVLDLFYFVQESLWWFEKLPLAPEALVARYREGIAQAVGYTWSDEAWNALWDYALMWTFLADWMDLLPTIPQSILVTRQASIQTLWLDPLKAAIARRLPAG